MQKTFVILFSLAIVGCASVDDFRGYSPEKRANLACNNRKEFRAMKDKKRELENLIEASNKDLQRGYKLHSQCKMVKVPDNYGSATCSSTGTNSATCTQYQSTSDKLECVDVPVPLDATLERSNLAQFQSDARALDSKITSTWNACTTYVSGLSAEDAFKFYKGR